VFCLHGGLSPSLDTLDNIRSLDRIQEVGNSVLSLWARFSSFHVQCHHIWLMDVLYSCMLVDNYDIWRIVYLCSVSYEHILESATWSDCLVVYVQNCRALILV
jgi:hypothetical protein